ncbi:hypothetical protein [Arthrobacter sp. ISL-69]|uniref:hypothetical protein n=1 Tax=Arthrobacter sp. ISL-69 TaxID=2819113 RepID=UPI001BE7F868|nr:hypothetical protein [Arthrobacter sp. ISL-69]MBT2537223.1 hypothetical protein [Arthrobacter sp. ISL-69]
MSCPVDGKPLHNNAVICGDCEQTMDRALGDLGSLLEDLDTALSRQSRKRPARGNHERDDKPLPYELGASNAASNLKAVLVAWARLVSDERPSTYERVIIVDDETTEVRTFHLDHTPLTCKDTSESISSWLMHHVTWLAHHEAAADAYSEIVGAVNNIRRTIDIAPDTRYVGPCGSVLDGIECTETLYALEGSDDATCRTCGTRWDTRARTLQTLSRALTVAQDATTLSRSFALRGIALDTKRIRNWADRKYLAGAGTSHRGHRTYIIAHVARLIQLYETGQKLTPWPAEQKAAAV